jgi:hypothetical protein
MEAIRRRIFMSREFNISFATSLRAMACVVFLAASVPGHAQNIPSASAQEGIIKRSLLTFNDANVTGNYTVMNALASKPFRESLSAEKLKETFKAFNEKHIDFGDIVLVKPVVTKPTTIDDDGVMVTEGYLDIPTMRVKYVLKHLLSDARWQLLGINVATDDPPK